MRRVYRVEHDTARFQYFLPASAEDASLLVGGCRKKAATWIPPRVTVAQPWLKAGNFYQGNDGLLIVDQRAAAALEVTNYVGAGTAELLPLIHDGQEYTVINVLECINCFDVDASEWLYAPDGSTRLHPTRYAFYGNRLGVTGLLKIPETYTSEILALEFEDYLEQLNVRRTVQREGLRGLRFTLLWEDPE